MIRFGPSGNSDSFYAQGYSATKQQPAWLYERGLNALEYSFGRGVRMTEKAAAEIRAEAETYDVQLSVHAPYYINMATDDPEKMENSIRYLVQSGMAARMMGAKRVVFHPGVTAADGRDASVQRIESLLKRAIKELDGVGLMDDIIFCPETMGKISQIGDLQETLNFCQLDKRLIPCLDFGHLHARSLGAFGNVREDYTNALDSLEQALGRARAEKVHIHFSRIEYTKAGEKRHWTYSDTQFGPEFWPLAQELAARHYEPVVICEAKGTMAEDAKTYQQLYEKAVKEMQS